MITIWDKLWTKENKSDVHGKLIEIIKKYTPGKKILEVGFGSGGDLLELSKSGFDCIGIESSRVAYQRARKNLPRNITIIFGDALKMPFKDEEFDAVYHQGVMEHFKDPRKFISQQWRVLKKGGVVIIDVPHKWNLYTVYKNIIGILGNWYGGWERSYSETELQKLLSRNNFIPVNISYRGIWPHRWGKFLYPEKIVQRKWLLSYLNMPPIIWIRVIFRYLYEKIGIIKALSSYNIIIVAKKKPTRVAIDARFAQGEGGGIYNYLTQLIKYLSEKGCEVITISDKPLGNKFPKTRNIVLNNYFHWLFWEQVQLPLTLYKLKPDIYLAAGNWGVPILHFCRTILTVHDVIPKIFQGYFDGSTYPILSKFLYQLRMQVNLIFSDIILCDSTSTASNIKDNFYVKSSKLNIVPLAIDHELLGKISQDDINGLNMLGIKKPYIVNHGGIDNRKNNEMLIKAFAQAGKSDPKIRNTIMVITGRNPEIEKKLINLAENLGIKDQVKLIGWVKLKDLAILVRNAQLVAYPTLAEGFGMPLLEAMVVGVPVVASNLPVLKEVGKDVPIYINPLDVESIARGLIRGIRGISKERLNKGKLLAKQYTWDRVLEKTYSLYVK